MINLPPVAYLLLAALIVIILPRRLASFVTPLAGIGILLLLTQAPLSLNISTDFLGHKLILFQMDQLSRVFGVIFALITAIAGLYALDQFSKGEQIAALIYAAGALGVTFAGDYISLYTCWELMALSSFYLVAVGPKKTSRQAAFRYFFVHLAGGVLLLGGILLEIQHSGTWLLNSLPANAPTMGRYLILAGIGVNVAMVPLHSWLPDAYPKAGLAGAVFLSALTTKTAVYTLLRLFPAWEILIPLGLVMALYGVIFAFLADDIRLVLAYHIVSQVGFMVTGVGMGTEMALNGAVAHAFCHILYKALLFMATGALIWCTGCSRLSQLGGLAKALPFVLALYLIGAVSISGLPGFNGFISKSMIIYAAELDHRPWITTLLYAASVGTFLSVGLKLPYFAWFHKKHSVKTKPLPYSMTMGMVLAAALCVLLGVYPQLLYKALPFPVEYEPYTASHIMHSFWMLGAVCLGFWLYLPKLKMKATDILDTDQVYRRPELYQNTFIKPLGRAFGYCEQAVLKIARTLSTLARNPGQFLRKNSLQDIRTFDPDAQRLPLAWTVSALLACFLLITLFLYW